MLQAIQDGYEFERQVCEILYKTNPYHLSHYDGGPDRGRDICVQYQYTGKTYDVIVECKYYSSGVNKEVIMPALDWAKVHQPKLLYLWIVPYLTPSAKDFVQAFEKEYKITVIIEEEVNIKEYLKYLHDDNAKIWLTLQQRILDSCQYQHQKNPFVPEYELDKNSPFLVDRESEREKLFCPPQKVFYLQGVSACGKTQLLKYIAFVFIQKDLPVFWHTIRPGNVEQQCSDFFHTLARYFEAEHRDRSLLEYFNTYGFYLSQDMENLVVSLLNKHNPILFIDDVHNCKNDNISMHTLFKKLIKYQVCRIYFSGWFNIFHLLPDEKKNICVIVLEGMRKKELDLIIQHCSGEHNLEVAELIEKQFHGLPGYAVLTNQELTANDINAECDFLAHFLTLLTPKERIVFFAVSLLSTDVPGDFLRKQGYAMELMSLESKHLLVVRRCCYTVHDNYRKFFSKCTIEEFLLPKVILLMDRYTSLEPSAFLDLINYRISEKNYVEAWSILTANFQVLISHQFYTELLIQLQEIERKARGTININEIVLKKIVLLERLGEYNLCLQYIRLLDNASLFNKLDQEMIFYIQLRCMYFTNQYDCILKLYNDNYSTVEAFNDRELYIQILLTIGRVFYIRGSSKGALIYYLLAYHHAQETHKGSLEIKAIHRIAMIERRIGLVTDSRATFQELSKLDPLITPKRRSYIFFRIAKCYFNEGNLEEAKEYNKKSIKIKESYNDARGLLFSDNLNAMICLKEGDYLGAYCYSTNACKRANKLGLNKEWLSAVLVRIRAALHTVSNVSDMSVIVSDIQQGLAIATDEKLLLRLKSIEKLAESHWPQIYSNARKKREMVEAELSTFEARLLEYYVNEKNFTLQKDYNALILHKTPISPSLLLRSGFLDPLQLIY